MKANALEKPIARPTMNIFELIQINKSLKAEANTNIKLRVITNFSAKAYDPWIANAFLRIGLNPKINYKYSTVVDAELEEIEADEHVICLIDIGVLFPNLAQKHLTLSAIEERDVVDYGKTLIQKIETKLNRCKSLLVQDFCAKLYTSSFTSAKTPLDRIATALNTDLETSKLETIPLTKLCSQVGTEAGLNNRDFYSRLIPYTNTLVSKIAHRISELFYPIAGEITKVLVLDCDNTLWRGVIGEDGIDGIKFRPSDRGGESFYEFHNILMSLKRQGMLLTLVTKNNPQEITEILESDDFMFGANDFVGIKARWTPKFESINELSQELNLGLDAFLFIDDNKLEIDQVLEYLPDCKTMLVDLSHADFVSQFRAITPGLGLKNQATDNSSQTDKYITEQKRSELKSQVSWDEYLKSVHVQVKYTQDKDVNVRRAAEMTQKTNQFNFTTQRRTPSEIEELIGTDSCKVVQLSIEDRFGDYGITGLIEISTDSNDVFKVTQLLLSCRVLGRGVEKEVMRYIDEMFNNSVNKVLQIEFVPSPKNAPAKVALTEFTGLSSEIFDSPGHLIRKKGENNWKFMK